MAAAVIVLAAACSSPDTTPAGFISLGRDGSESTGAVGSPGKIIVPTGGTGTSGTGNVGTGGTIVSGGNAGASTIGQGGTTGTNGGTAGDANGGTSTGGDGPSCGSGGMPTVTESFTYDMIRDGCDRAGRNERVCLTDDSVFYCGHEHGAIIEYCRSGTCQSGCCHATFDPCPDVSFDAQDCNGDCVGYRGCSEAPIVNLPLQESGLQIVRVGGQNTMEETCGSGTRRYFALFLSGRWARVTVSPPWFLAEAFTCEDVSSVSCLLSDSEASTERFVIVMTDADPPPPRNVVIETSLNVLLCPLD